MLPKLGLRKNNPNIDIGIGWYRNRKFRVGQYRISDIGKKANIGHPYYHCMSLPFVEEGETSENLTQSIHTPVNKLQEAQSLRELPALRSSGGAQSFWPWYYYTIILYYIKSSGSRKRQQSLSPPCCSSPRTALHWVGRLNADWLLR